MKLSRIIAVIAVAVYLTSMSHDANAWLLAPERQPDSNKGTAVITGHGPALPDEHVVRLFKIEDDGLAHVAATDTIANGQFRFEIPVEEGLSVYSFMFDYHALPNTNHKLYVTLVHINAGRPRVNVSLPTSDHLLIGCDFEWNFNENDTIPLVSYATGIPMKYDLGNGEVVDAFYVCGLRFSKIHPSKWKEEYNLSDYLYFEAIPVKEMSF